VCRRAKIQPQMVATLYPLRVTPRPWHIVGLDYLTHLPESNGFNIVLIVTDHVTRMAHFLSCTYIVITAEETATCFYTESTDYMDYSLCLSVIATLNSSVAYGTHFGDA
jgi:hypothetical protein